MFIIHKPGQGYWTRLMSLIGGGALIAAGAMWAWDKLSAVRIPIQSWNFTVSDPTGETPGIGERVVIIGRNGMEVGSGLVESATSTLVALTGVQYDGARNDLDALTTLGGYEALTVPPVEILLFQREFLQGGIAALVLLIGGGIIYYFCYANRKSSDFLIATEGEMKKVNWSTRREIFGSTWVVIVISLIIASVLFIADLIFSNFFTWLRVIEMA